MKFKEFLKYYSYIIVRIFVDQLAISIFALAVAIGTAHKYMNLAIASSVFSVLFLLFMIGDMTFRAGVTDKEKTEIGRFKKNAWTGLIVSAFANIPNLILAFGYLVFGFFDATKDVAAFFNIAAKLIYGEYLGILSIKIGETALGLMPVSFFIIIIPSLIVATIGYILGVNGIITPKPTKKDLE